LNIDHEKARFVKNDEVLAKKRKAEKSILCRKIAKNGKMCYDAEQRQYETRKAGGL